MNVKKATGQSKWFHLSHCSFITRKQGFEYDLLVSDPFKPRDASWEEKYSTLKINAAGKNKIIEALLKIPDSACYRAKKKDVFFSIGNTFGIVPVCLDDENRLKLFLEINEIIKNNNSIESPFVQREEKLDSERIDESLYQKLWEKFYSAQKARLEKRNLYSKPSRFRIFERDNFGCRICGRHAPEVILHIDHWIPKSKGGADSEENYVTLCRDCNCSKSDIMPKQINWKFALSDEKQKELQQLLNTEKKVMMVG